jgi:hypothetical protein
MKTITNPAKSMPSLFERAKAELEEIDGSKAFDCYKCKTEFSSDEYRKSLYQGDDHVLLYIHDICPGCMKMCEICIKSIR